MQTIVTTTSKLPLEADDLVVTIHNPVLVAAGEYADAGEPSILVHVVTATDEDGEDIRLLIAELIANTISELPEGDDE